MKKLKLQITIIVIILLSIYIPAQTVDDIVDMHFDAAKQDLFNRVKTLVINSEITSPDGLIKQNTYYKRPDKMKIEEIKNGITSLKSFDGTNGWFISPSDGITTPTLLTGNELLEVKFMANLDGYFFCYKNRGYKITFEGTEKISGRDTYKMKCKTNPADSTYIYVDAKTYLFRKIIKPAINKETFIDNYKEVKGIPFPFKFETNLGGVKSTQIVKSIQLDVDLEDAFFQMPAK